MTSGPTMNRFILAMCHFNFRENKKDTNSERQNSKIKKLKLKINLLFYSILNLFIICTSLLLMENVIH